MSLIKKYVGSKDFYKIVLAIALPMMVQQGITTFVNLLDNIMVGQLGTLSMSAVTIVNEFVFIYNLAIFGAVSGAGIFAAQFFGKRDFNGMRYTFRFKLIINLLCTLVAVLVLLFLNGPLINLYLKGDNTPEEKMQTIALAKDYLYVILIGLVPFSITQVYSSAMKETGSTVPPMIASIIAIITNLFLNYVLIFGQFGAPALGVKGAAIATTVSRFLELGFLIIWTHTHSEKYAYIKEIYHSLHIPKDLAFSILRKGLPIMGNELFWSLGMVIATQCYATRGIEVVAAFNITTTIFNLFSVVHMTMGSTISIMVGNKLGAGELDTAQDYARKLSAFCITLSLIIMLFMIALSGLIPQMYNTEDEVRAIATYVIRIDGLFMCVYAFTNCAYFTLRSGGKVFVTILFDSVFSWAVFVPVCLLLAYATNLSIQVMYVICASTEFGKAIIGYIFLKQKKWVNQLVKDDEFE